MRRRTGIWVGAVVIVAVLVPTAVAVARTTGATRSAATGRATGGVTPTTTVAPARFTHPGVLVGRAQLDLVRSKVDAGEQPWKSAYDQMRTSQYASLSRDPKPRSTVECGLRSNPDNGCTEERTDGLAAYADALMWYIARDDRYARKAIQIMDAWSAVLKERNLPYVEAAQTIGAGTTST